MTASLKNDKLTGNGWTKFTGNGQLIQTGTSPTAVAVVAVIAQLQQHGRTAFGANRRAGRDGRIGQMMVVQLLLVVVKMMVVVVVMMIGRGGKR